MRVYVFWLICAQLAY